MCKLSQALSTLIESKMAMWGYGHGDIIKRTSGQTYRNPTYLLVFQYIVSCQPGADLWAATAAWQEKCKLLRGRGCFLQPNSTHATQGLKTANATVRIISGYCK